MDEIPEENLLLITKEDALEILNTKPQKPFKLSNYYITAIVLVSMFLPLVIIIFGLLVVILIIPFVIEYLVRIWLKKEINENSNTNN